MKTNQLILLFLFLSVWTFGQYDPKAKDILDKVSNKTKTYKTLKIDYSSVIHNAESGVDEKNDGTLWQMNDMYKLKFMDAITFFNGKNKWVYMPDVQEVNLFGIEQEDDDIFNNPQKIFTIYKNGFKYFYKGDALFNNVKYTLIELIPEDKNLDYFKIKLYIDITKYHIMVIEYFAKDGTRINIKIKKYSPNIKLTKSFFTYSKKEHPEAEIIDMRE